MLTTLNERRRDFLLHKESRKAVEADEFFPLDNTNEDVARGLSEFADIFGDLWS